jgi:hypothetical protein
MAPRMAPTEIGQDPVLAPPILEGATVEARIAKALGRRVGDADALSAMNAVNDVLPFYYQRLQGVGSPTRPARTRDQMRRLATMAERLHQELADLDPTPLALLDLRMRKCDRSLVWSRHDLVVLAEVARSIESDAARVASRRREPSLAVPVLLFFLRRIFDRAHGYGRVRRLAARREDFVLTVFELAGIPEPSSRQLERKMGRPRKRRLVEGQQPDKAS